MSHQPCPRCGEIVRDPDDPDRAHQIGDHRCRGFRVTTRGSFDRPIVAEYLCPEHGRFALTVDRDANGDAPDEAKCMAWLPPDRLTYCGKYAPYVISATAGARVRSVEVVRGGYQKPERPTWTDTTNIGEGQDLDDWHDERDKVWERDREDSIKELIDG